MDRLKRPGTIRRTLKGMGRRPAALPEPEGMGRKRSFSLVDEELERITQAVGDEKLAKRVLKLMQGEYPNATIPEAVAIDWAQRRGLHFVAQTAVFGGRAALGGLVPDMVVATSNGAMVWQIQGNYWHQRPGKREEDALAKMRLLGEYVYGMGEVTTVVEIWESRIVDPARREGVFTAALGGTEMGP